MSWLVALRRADTAAGCAARWGRSHSDSHRRAFSAVVPSANPRSRPSALLSGQLALLRVAEARNGRCLLVRFASSRAAPPSPPKEPALQGDGSAAGAREKEKSPKEKRQEILEALRGDIVYKRDGWDLKLYRYFNLAMSMQFWTSFFGAVFYLTSVRAEPLLSVDQVALLLTSRRDLNLALR